MRFIHHAEAGQRLAGMVERMAGTDPVVLALPQAGVRIAREIARYLGAPLDVLLYETVVVPGAEQCRLGMVIEGELVADPVACEPVPGAAEYAEVLANSVRHHMARRSWVLRGGRGALDRGTSPVVLVGDGSVPLTDLAGLAAWLVRKQARRVIYAAPVGCQGLERLASDRFQALTLFDPEEFRSVMLVNRGNRQTTDDEISRILREHRVRLPWEPEPRPAEALGG